MSIHCITGEPGAGKSLYVVKNIVDVIVNTDRPIVTNMAFKLDPWLLGSKAQMGLCAYLEREHGEDFNVRKRIRFLSDEQVYEFYRYRGGNIDIGVEKGKKGELISLKWDELMERKGEWGAMGVEYVLDEFWKYCGSRSWQTNDAALFDYGKQHRKPGDNVWIMTHHHKDIDAAVQRIIEQTVCMRNHGRMRLGFFRQPDMITAAHFARIPSGSGAPMNTQMMRVDKAGLAQCYDTSAGVGGLSGGVSADTSHKRKGLPVWVLVCLVVLGLAAVTRIPWLLGWAVNKSAMGGLKSATKGMAAEITNSMPRAVLQSSNPLPVHAIEPPVFREMKERRDELPGQVSDLVRAGGKLEKVRQPVDALPEDDKVSFVGFVNFRGLIMVCLSDGSTYRVGDPELQFVSDKLCIINGKVYKWPRNVVEEAKVTQRNLASANPVRVLTPAEKVYIAEAAYRSRRPIVIDRSKVVK